MRTYPRAWRCRKRRYPTEAKAVEALKAARVNHAGQDHIEDHAYPCPLCHGWHLTSQRTRPTPERADGPSVPTEGARP